MPEAAAAMRGVNLSLSCASRFALSPTSASTMSAFPAIAARNSTCPPATPVRPSPQHTPPTPHARLQTPPHRHHRDGTGWQGPDLGASRLQRPRGRGWGKG